MSDVLEYKATPLHVLGIDDRVVKQIFAVTGNLDYGDDRIWAGAFAKTLNESLDRVRVLWQHDGTQPPIGAPVVAKEIGVGDLPAQLKSMDGVTGALYAEVKYLDTPRGNEVLAGIRDGAIRENSIGYLPVQGKVDYENLEGKRIRNLHEVRLRDLSPVNWGMNAATLNLKQFAPHEGKVDITPDTLTQLLAWINAGIGAGAEFAQMDAAAINDLLYRMRDVSSAMNTLIYEAQKTASGKSISPAVLHARARALGQDLVLHSM